MRVCSRYTGEAIRLLSAEIKAARIERGITAKDLAERADISRGLLRRIEQADPACSIGVVFEVSNILGIQLFQSDYNNLISRNKILGDKITLLPSRVRKIKMDNDF